KIIQNVFTISKTGSLALLVLVGVILGWKHDVVAANFGHLWNVRGTLQNVGPSGGNLLASSTLGLFVAICVAQTSSLFSADAWNNITFTAGEVKNPKRDIPISLAVGTAVVITLYFLANLGYLSV